MADATSDGLGTERPPSIDALARSLGGTGLPHPLLVDAARSAVARAGRGGSTDAITDVALAEAERLRAGLLQPVVNGTGVLLHTNLGRAPLEVNIDSAYLNLEHDLATGRRGSRQAHVGGLLARACGAEAALVVNNGAAALLVVLAAVAGGQRVVVSRGELVEIGGGFRIPEVMALSRATLVEVGTTNRTRLQDYRDMATDAALLVKVHPSNYRITGFTSSVDVAALAGIGPPVAVDVGSGLLDAACPWLPGGPPAWLSEEPGVRQALDDGAKLVTFSGDKLLGGPQAGVIAGSADLVAACASHPLYRAVRPGGLVLRALQDVALAYLNRTAYRLPFWRLATVPDAELRARAEHLVAGPAPSGTQVTSCAAVAGGGSLPGVEIPSWGVAVPGDHADALRRARQLPVVARVREGTTVINLRSVDVTNDPVVADALAALSK